MPKVSQLPPDAAPTTSDYLVGNQASGPSTVRYLISTLINFFWTLANIPSGSTSPITRDAYTTQPFVTGTTGTWSADSAGTNRNASMTQLIFFINGRFITINAVTARTFTASRDTYIDALDNGDGTGTLVYTEVTNNAASPALAANSVRIGIIVTGATTIANAGSINQGQENALLPIAASSPYAVTESLGNLICPRDPNRKILGLRQAISAVTSTTAGSEVTIPVLVIPFQAPGGRKVKVSIKAAVKTSGVASTPIGLAVLESSTYIAQTTVNEPVAAYNSQIVAENIVTPTAGLHTYSGSMSQQNAGTITLEAGTGALAGYGPVQLVIEQE